MKRFIFEFGTKIKCQFNVKQFTSKRRKKGQILVKYTSKITCNYTKKGIFNKNEENIAIEVIIMIEHKVMRENRKQLIQKYYDSIGYSQSLKTSNMFEKYNFSVFK